MGTALLALFFVTAGVSFLVGLLVADHRFCKILDRVSAHYRDQTQRILESPVYLAQPPAFEGDDRCPDCGEVHDDPDDGESGSGVN